MATDTWRVAFYKGTIPVLCIVGPRISLQYMGLAFYKPIFEKLEGSLLPAHSSAGLAGVSFSWHDYNQQDIITNIRDLLDLYRNHTGSHFGWVKCQV